jgi:hypothetical protein
MKLMHRKWLKEAQLMGVFSFVSPCQFEIGFGLALGGLSEMKTMILGVPM